MSWLKFGLSVGLAWFGFWYSGPAQPLVRAIVVVFVAGAVAAEVVRRPQRSTVLALGSEPEPPHTELVIECNKWLLLKQPAYDGCRKAIEEAFERRDSQLPEEQQQAFPELESDSWKIVFLGTPGTGDTIVWSSRNRFMFPDDTLIYEQLWTDLFRDRESNFSEAKEEEPIEPPLVLELAEDSPFGYKNAYRMFVRRWGVKPDVLAWFPVSLLRDGNEDKLKETAVKAGLRCLENKTDTFQNAFGDWDLSWEHGAPFRVYESEQGVFLFKVLHHWGGRA